MVTICLWFVVEVAWVATTVYQLSPNFFVCRHWKLNDQISQHTSHVNLFPMVASGNNWRSPLLQVTISGSCVMLPEMVLIFKKKVHFLSRHNCWNKVSAARWRKCMYFPAMLRLFTKTKICSRLYPACYLRLQYCRN